VVLAELERRTMSTLRGEQLKMGREEAKAFVDRLYEKVAARWKERITDAPFMQKLRSGSLSPKALRLFFTNWGSFTIEINSLEAASYHKHIAFFRTRDLSFSHAGGVQSPS
jgi:hypothetical protein